MAARLEDAEQRMRRLSMQETDRYLVGCADTYRELALLIRDEIARYQEQHL